MPVQRLHHRDCRHHRVATALADHDQYFRCGLPFRRLLFGVGQLGDVQRSIAQRDRLAPVWQFDWIEECLVPRQKRTPLRKRVGHQS
jgi:hypothetical protein